MIKLCFYQRLALTLVTVFLLVLGVFFTTTVHLQDMTRMEAEQRLHLGLAEHLGSDAPLLKAGVYDYEALKALFHTLMILGPNFEFYFVAPDGEILTYSASPGEIKSQRIDVAPLETLLNNQYDLPVMGDDPRRPNRNKIFSVAEVFNQNRLQGYLYVVIGGQASDSIIEAMYSSRGIQQVGVFALAGLVFLLIAALILFKYFTRPLKILSEEMEQIRDAGYQQTADSRELTQWRRESHNEVQRLGCAFHDMLTHIDEQFLKLQQTDQQRREMLADLSHDLRTPLANLQGYIETLALNGDRLSVEERQRFTDITLKNSRNLKRLIDQIFELAYLEGGQVTLHKETFPLGELLHDISAKFAISAKERDIQLSVEPGQCDYLVMADIGKLERIMTNLIENALRHTPAGGHITLRVSTDDDKLRIDVCDSGVGIHEKELAFIFNARYQASNQAKDNALHAGLGLAICHKLTALLGSELSVKSRIGEGTEFSFMLPLARSAV